MTSLVVFFAAALLPRLWNVVRARRWGLPVVVTADPERTGPREMAAYLAEIARRMDEAPERMRIRFRTLDAEAGEPAKEWRVFTLDVRPDGRLEVNVPGRRARAFDLRGRWIPEHAVPLTLCGGGKSAVLYAAPTDAGRFRVMDRLPGVRLPGAAILLSLAAAFGVVEFVPEALAFALGGALAAAGVRRSWRMGGRKAGR